ncbi:MAG: prepilin-type N-terminal cleavage/methylation domain-containing protein [Cyanobacteria bacterium J06649_4]
MFTLYLLTLSFLPDMRFLFLFYQQLHFRQTRQKSKGFTLVELLISLVVAAFVMTGLMTVVVEMTKMDQRETIVDQVQRDMNRAMEYIRDDLQEAVYVYTDPGLVSAQLAADPNFPGDTGEGEVPILAFWRIDPIEDSIPNCDGLPADRQPECRLLEVRQAAYTLVVYSQKTSDNNRNWSGQSRLIRYELSKYSNISTLTWRDGYRDPTDPLDPLAQFNAWTATGTPRGSQAVLADYVQDPSALPLDRAPLSDAGVPCEGYGLDAFGNSLYSVVPPDAAVNNNNSFFACVRNPSVDNAVAVAGNTNGNQDVYIFLRGNVQGTTTVNGVNTGIRSFSDRASLPILETQVLVKGVINKGFR